MEYKFSNGTRCFIGRKTNFIALGQWLIKKGVPYSEMPPVVQRALCAYWLGKEVKRELRQAQIAVMVRCELEGMSPDQIAEKYGMDPAVFSRFKNANRELFRAEYERYGGDVRVQAIRSYLATEQKLAAVMPEAANAIAEVIRDPESGASVRAKTSLELIKLMRQDSVQKRLMEFDDAFGELVKETAERDFVLIDLDAADAEIETSLIGPGESDDFKPRPGEVVAEAVDEM